MQSGLKRPSVHDEMPSARKRGLEIYSIAMQQYQSLWKRIPEEHRPTALPTAQNSLNVMALHNRTELVLSRCWRMERLIAHLGRVDDKKDCHDLPPHLRVLMEPAAGCPGTENHSCELRGHSESAGPYNQRMKPVRTPWPLRPTNQLIGVLLGHLHSQPRQHDKHSTLENGHLAPAPIPQKLPLVSILARAVFNTISH
jgi:hypothetical protein